MELKHDRIEKKNVDGDSLNCTVMELKRYKTTASVIVLDIVLIVPLWN